MAWRCVRLRDRGPYLITVKRRRSIVGQGFCFDCDQPVNSQFPRYCPAASGSCMPCERSKIAAAALEGEGGVRDRLQPVVSKVAAREVRSRLVREVACWDGQGLLILRVPAEWKHTQGRSVLRSEEFITVRPVDYEELAADADCECVMTEGSLRACPKHGEDEVVVAAFNERHEVVV
jgi:hypothetical protein